MPYRNEGPRANIPADEWYKGRALYKLSEGFKPPRKTGTSPAIKKLGRYLKKRILYKEIGKKNYIFFSGMY